MTVSKFIERKYAEHLQNLVATNFSEKAVAAYKQDLDSDWDAFVIATRYNVDKEITKSFNTLETMVNIVGVIEDILSVLKEEEQNNESEDL